jgi:SAM-dependent methyltransferase
VRVVRGLLAGVLWSNAKGKRLAIRLTKWTGKSPEYVHPKHLLPDDEAVYWYLPHVRAGDRILDVGCGNAMHSLKAARLGARVAGVDRDEGSLRVGQRSAPAGTPLRLCVADVEEGLPFANRAFDRVVCLDLLEHVEKRDTVLTEIRRVLRPDGVLLLTVPNRGTRWKRTLEAAGLPSYSDPDHKIEYLLPELEDELARNGFVIATLVPSVVDMPLVGLIDVLGGLSLTVYRRLTALRRRLAERHPAENAGWCAVCLPR